MGARLCPPVLDAAGTLLDEDTATLVAQWANEYWTFLLQDFHKREADGLGEPIVYPARRVVLYRLRLRDWRGVRAMLGLISAEEAFCEVQPIVRHAPEITVTRLLEHMGLRVGYVDLDAARLSSGAGRGR